VTSALVVVVNELATAIDRWRLPTVRSAAAGAPAHVTALSPWRSSPVSQLDVMKLATVVATIPAMTLTFDRLDRFPKGVLFLSLIEASTAAVRDLTRTLLRHYPECVPYGGEHPDPHPHLTVACGTNAELDIIEAEVEPAISGRLPFTVCRDEVEIIELQTSGRWLRTHRLPLRGRTPSFRW
jgi:hypothetical protein